MSAQAAANTPWEFRARAFVIFIAFGAGFLLGYLAQGFINNDFTPTFAVLGRRWGDAGVDAAAFVAAGLVVAAWLLRWWASSYHAPGVVMSPQVVTGTFTAAGPYRFVRNPLYLGNILLSLGVGLLGVPVATILVVIFNFAFVYRLIAIEEAYLRRSEGEAYAAYCKAVPRMLPRLTPAVVPDDGRRLDVPAGGLEELYMFGFAAATVYSAIAVAQRHVTDTSWPAFWAIAVGATLLQFALRAALRRPTS